MNASMKWDSATLSGGTYRLQDTKVFRTVSQIMLRVTAETTVSVSTGTIVMDSGSAASVVLGAGVFLASAIPEGWNIEQVDAFAPVVASPVGVTGVDIAAFDGGDPNGLVTATKPTIGAGRNGGGIWARDLTATGSSDWYELAQQSDLDRIKLQEAYASRALAVAATVPAFVMIIHVISSRMVVSYRRTSGSSYAISTNSGTVMWEAYGEPRPEHFKDGDPSTEDFTLAIYSCLNSYRVCYLSGRTYLCKELEIPSQSSIVGAGFARTTLKLPDASNTYIAGTSAWKNSTLGQDSQVQIRGITFDGNAPNNPTSPGLVYIRSWLGRVTECQFQYSSGYGLVEAYTGRNGTTVTTLDVGDPGYNENIFRYCAKEGFYADGVYVDPSHKGAADGHFCNNIIAWCGTSGTNAVTIKRASGWHILDNHAYGSGLNTFGIASLAATQFRGNYVEVNGNYAPIGSVVAGLSVDRLVGDYLMQSVIANNIFLMRGNTATNPNGVFGGAVSGVTYCAIKFTAPISSTVVYGPNSIFDWGLGSDCQAYYFGYDKVANPPTNCRFIRDAVNVPIAAGHEMFVNPITVDMG